MRTGRYTRFIVTILMILLYRAGDVWAGDITVTIGDITANTGTVTQSIDQSTRVVTLTVTPASNYYIKASDIVVEKLVSANNANARRRVPNLANRIEGKMYKQGAEKKKENEIYTIANLNIAEYVFTVPDGYDGVYVTATFTARSNTEIEITSSTTTVTYDKTGTYVLLDDIDASVLANLYTGSKVADNEFAGTLKGVAKADGTFPVIRNLDHPLFATATGATISNIMFKDITVTGSGPVGAVCGTANGTTRIYNCGVLPTNTTYDNDGNITGFTGSTVSSSGDYCGSFVGYLDGYARVINCFSYANIISGSTVGGIVGYNTTATMQGNNQTNFNNNVKTMVVNCMFYGDISGGTTKYPVYGGEAFVNNAADKVNNYNYYFEQGASYDDTYTAITDYNYSWPVAEKHLTRYEVYRSILNSNRRLCTWWVNGTYKKDAATDATDENVESVGIAKWVLDRTIAPYPILKKWGKYYSTFDIDPDFVWNPTTKTMVARSIANPWEGKSYGTLSVTINGGSNNSGASRYKNITITDMDTLGFDYCARKIQLPYYNEVFGNPEADTWAAKYANNYTTKVVTGWKITAVNHSGKNSFVANWENGYNFADRDCTEKDIYSSNNPRVFAQGGYYYVPNGVTAITIEAYWGNAVYLCNSNRRLDKMNNGSSEFYVSGKLPEKVGGVSTNPAVKTSLKDAIGELKKISESDSPGNTVYDQAMVLVGNFQDNSCHSNLLLSGNNYDSDAKPFTIMSADFDFDNEPDFCFQAGMYNVSRPNFQPVRFDFLMVPDITMAIRTVDLKYYGIRNISPQGHFEVTETSYMYVTQFEYEIRTENAKWYKHEAPVILNGGEFMQIVSTHKFTEATVNATATARADRTSYFLMGGKLYMKAFTPGAHVNTRSATRHCAVNAIGGEFPEFYLSGMFRSDFYNMTDNPHAYLDGGWFGTVAGAGMESVGAENETNGGNVTFKINHSRIHEFYGGGINAKRPVTGNINVTCDNSIVHKYCGGPKLGDMSSSKTITTSATSSVFDQFYGGGNGGTNMLRENKYDGWDVEAPTKDNHERWDKNQDKYGRFSAFSPLKYESNKGYHAEFEFELLPIPSGLTTTVPRTYYHYASFSKTTVAPITTTITDCTFNGNFYGGGNLGAVGGNVTTTLQGHTVVHGSVFGAGFSASIPSIQVHDKSTVVYPYRDFAGFIHDGSLDHSPTKYTWIHEIPTEWGKSPNLSNNTDLYFKDPSSNNWYIYTDQPLTGLGTVNGNATITIKGTTEVDGNVFGGGAQSTVNGNATVILQGDAQITGNVFGGGDNGKVMGSTTVNIEQ